MVTSITRIQSPLRGERRKKIIKNTYKEVDEERNKEC
jgi:hypothetical protein